MPEETSISVERGDQQEGVDPCKKKKEKTVKGKEKKLKSDPRRSKQHRRLLEEKHDLALA